MKEEKTELSEEDRDYYLENTTFGNLFLVMLLLVLLKKDVMLVLELNNREAVYLDLLLQYNVTEKNSTIKD
jgi:hypothetical protein